MSVRVVPDTDGFRRKTKQDLERETSGLDAEIEVNPDLSGFRERVRAATKGLDTTVKVHAETDQRSLRSVRSRMSKIFEAPSFGSGLNPSAYAVVFGGIAALAGPVVGVLTTALAALPGLLAAVATPIAAITLGLDGLTKAAEVLKSPFDQLKATMSAVNERAFTPVFTKLGRIFPALEKSIPTVSNGLASIADSIVGAFTSPDGMTKIERSIVNIGEGLRRSAPGFGDFTAGITGLIDEFTKKMPAIGDWLSGTGSDFKRWITEMSENGSLPTAFDGLGKTVTTILDGLGKIGQTGLEFMSDPKKLENFTAALRGVFDLMNQIVVLSGKINEWRPPDWTMIKPGDENADGLFSGAFPGMVNPNKDKPPGWLDKLEGLLKNPDSWKVGTNLDGNALELPDFGPAKTLLADFATYAAGIWASVSASATNAWTTVQSVWSGAGVVLSGIWNGVSESASAAWSNVSTTIATAWANIEATVQNGIANVLGFVGSMGAQIYSAITSIDLGSAGSALMDGLLGGIRAGAQKVYDFVSGIASKIASLKGPLPYDRQVLIPNGQALMEGLGTGLENGLTGVLDMAKQMAEQISRAMSEGTTLSVDPSQLKQAMDALELERKRLKVESNSATTDDRKKALKDTIQQLDSQRDLLSYQTGLTKEQSKYSDSVSSTAASWEDSLGSIVATAAKFATANVNQVTTDLGMSGTGAIPTITKELMNWGLSAARGMGNVTIQTTSMDEALAAHNRLLNRQALQYAK